MKGTVKIPSGYFLKMARHDYRNYKEALPREFYQNSIDAGARNIWVTVDRSGHSIRVKDDGCGMTLEVLKDKLLVLGGSYKGIDNAAGVFGKAKELLFFSWEAYTIKTNQWVVEGKGPDWEIKENGDRIKGTEVTLKIQSEESLIPTVVFERVARKMDVSCKFHINGKTLMVGAIKGTLKKSLDWVNIYQRTDKIEANASVRIQGIWMFDTYVGSRFGALTFDLAQSSLKCLTSNRDGLLYTYQSKLESLLSDMTINKESFFRKEKTNHYERIPGSGPIKVTPSDLKRKFYSENFNKHLAAHRAVKLLEDSGVSVTELRAHRVQDIDFMNESQEMSISKLVMIGYEPDFVIKHQGQRNVDQFVTSLWGGIIAKMWTEVTRQVLMDNGQYIEFMVGFNFNSDQDAEMELTNGQYHFYLNPMTLGRDAGYRAPTRNKGIIIHDLRQRACHEIAHMLTKSHNHDETFVCAMHKVEARTWDSEKTFNLIKRIN